MTKIQAKDLFIHAKTIAGLNLIRGQLAKNNQWLHIKNDIWEEGLVHWAALSTVGLLIDFQSLGADLNQKDKTGRRPLDWIVEKLYYLTTDPPKELSIPFLNQEIKNAELVVLFLLQQTQEVESWPKTKVSIGYYLTQIGIESLLKEYFNSLLNKPIHQTLWEQLIVGFAQSKRLSEKQEVLIGSVETILKSSYAVEFVVNIRRACESKVIDLNQRAFLMDIIEKSTLSLDSK